MRCWACRSNCPISSIEAPVGAHVIPQVEAVAAHVIPQVGAHVIPMGDAGVASPVWSSQSESCSRRNELTGALVARRSFNVVDVTEILIHWHAGRSQSELASSLGVDRKTVRKYVAPAIEAGIAPGDAPRSSGQWAELVRSWWPGLVDTRLRQTTWPQIEVHHQFVVDMLAAGVTQQTIWQRLRDEHGLTASVASLKRYVAANLAEDVLRSRVTVLRETPPPGQEAQIDYGYLGSWVDPVGGRTRRVWAFVMVLACSRHIFVRPVLSMDQAAWTQAHVEAFAFFGGVTARLVPDNLRTGIERPDLYDPKINRSYAELAGHYDTLIDPARVRKPKDKARVERPMPYVRDSFWRGREFTSLAAMQAAAISWCTDVAGHRSCRPLGGAAPLTVLHAVERSALKPLPQKRFVLAAWSRGTVGPDIHVKVGRCLYSVPWRFLGQKVDARATLTMVQIFANGELIHPPGQDRGQTERHGPLPAGEDRVRDADADLVPNPGRAGRPARRRRDRRSAGRQRAVPPARRAGRTTTGRQVRPGPPRRRLRQSDQRGRPHLPHRQRHPRRRGRGRPATTGQRGRRRAGVPARPGATVRQRRGPARHQRAHRRRARDRS